MSLALELTAAVKAFAEAVMTVGMLVVVAVFAVSVATPAVAP